jgi:hypothetical protein
MHAPTFHSACGWEHLSVWAQRAKAVEKKTRLEFTGYLFDDSVIIGLSSRSVDTIGLELRYSIGADSNPCCMTNSVKYRQPFCLNTLGTTVIKAVCLQRVTGCQSEVVEAAFTVIEQPVEPPRIANPENGSKHTKEVVVSMSLDPNRANYQATNIHYTTDGSAPTALSTAWLGTGLVSRLQVQQLPLIYTNTDYCLLAFCTWVLTTGGTHPRQPHDKGNCSLQEERWCAWL